MTLGFLLPANLPAAEPSSHADSSSAWDLTLLYKDDAAWHAAKDHLAAEIPKIKNYQGRLGESAATLREAMDLIYGLHKDLDRMAVYSSLKRDGDTRDSAALELSQEADLLGTEFSRATSFVNPELQAVGEAKLRAFLDADPGLAPYRFPIMEVLRAAPHTLGAEAEGVLSAAGLDHRHPGLVLQHSRQRRHSVADDQAGGWHRGAVGPVWLYQMARRAQPGGPGGGVPGFLEDLPWI